MRTSIAVPITIFLLGILAVPTPCVTPTSNELALAEQNWEQWFGDRLGGCYLEIVSQDVADGIGRGKSWRGTPYQIGEKTYTHGLAFNSTKQIRLHFHKPAIRFTAEVGLENNDDTCRGAESGQGSVTFQVKSGDRVFFSSPVMRLQDAPRPIDIALPNVRELDIAVGDGGDGRGWDQAVWAEAFCYLEDGSKVRLQDILEKNVVEYNPFGFSFLYDGRPSADFIGQWQRSITASSKQADWIERAVCFTDPHTQLEIHIESRRYTDFPAYEWVIKFKNNGDQDTPILESILPMDQWLPISSGNQTVLHWSKGGVASFDDFAPQEQILKPNTEFHLQPGGGRSSNQVLPFFNLEGSNGGAILGIGWSGEWQMDLIGKTGGVVIKSGMAKTHLLLHPGEEIRTPRLLTLLYEGDLWRGQNLFRQLILKHYRPLRDGQPLEAPITCGNWGGTSAEIHLDNIRMVEEHRLPLEYYWIDAEWYGKPGGPGTWAVNVGSWDHKKELYPNGFKPLSDALKSTGRKLMLWFEPERVFKDTAWWNERSQWLFEPRGDNALFNLGIPEARRFLIDFLSNKIDEYGIGCYRQDFNIDPLPFWQAADSPDRVGMSEIRYIEGLYEFWDELLRRHPGLIIDNCASGGRRIDLETTRRSTPFWRTDGPRDPIAHQCHTFGLLRWIPFSATSQDRASDDYEFRSSMCSSLCLNWWISGDKPADRIPADFPFEWARKTLEQYVQYRQYYYGDYYPLTNYSQAKEDWMAYQLHCGDRGEGLVVVLKRPKSPYVAAAFPLHDLEPQADYLVTDLSTGKVNMLKGESLAEDGLKITLEARPDSALFVYKKKP